MAAFHPPRGGRRVIWKDVDPLVEQSASRTENAAEDVRAEGLHGLQRELGHELPGAGRIRGQSLHHLAETRPLRVADGLDCDGGALEERGLSREKRAVSSQKGCSSDRAALRSAASADSNGADSGRPLW